MTIALGLEDYPSKVIIVDPTLAKILYEWLSKEFIPHDNHYKEISDFVRELGEISNDVR